MFFLADRFGPPPAIKLFGAAIPELDHSFQIPNDNRIRAQIQQPRLLGQPALASLGFVQHPVEGIGKDTDLVLGQLRRANGIVSVLADAPRGLGERQDGVGNPLL